MHAVKSGPKGAELQRQQEQADKALSSSVQSTAEGSSYFTSLFLHTVVNQAEQQQEQADHSVSSIVIRIAKHKQALGL